MKRLAVIDLDGTLCRGNTLHLYMMCGLRLLLKQRRVGAVLRLTALMTFRALRLISHRRMKWSAFDIIPAGEPALRNDFVRRFQQLRDPSVDSLIERLRENGCLILLATAAGDVYVPWIWHDDYIATPMHGNPGRVEMRGTVKRDAVLRYCTDKDLTLYAVVTDHRDDLPLLMTGARHKYLVRPDSATRMAADMAGVRITNIF